MAAHDLSELFYSTGGSVFKPSGSSASVNNLSRVPSGLRSAVSGQKSMTGKLSGQANKLNALSGSYGNTASSINSVAIPNLLKYGEVSESDLVGSATTDNALAYGKAWDAAQRNLSRMGINPNSGRFAGANQDFALMRAAAEAGARNQARIQARQENFNRAQTLAGLGKGYDSLSLSAAGNALSGYNAAANNQNQLIASTASMYNWQNAAAKDRAIESRLSSITDLGDGNFAKGLQLIYGDNK